MAPRYSDVADRRPARTLSAADQSEKDGPDPLERVTCRRRQLWRPGQNAFTTSAIGVLGGLPMAATTSAVTALALRRLPGPR
ncbi:hypothetical protein [Amycolatopsis sp. NBC_00438]|uniref:hypothetical protein n=1 Tax=Amycolatopsis sp. NBC_00438 TaxID=2903558 RepID=UPI002E220B9C